MQYAVRQVLGTERAHLNPVRRALRADEGALHRRLSIREEAGLPEGDLGVYAQVDPDRVIGTGSGREIEWITGDMGRVFPRGWERFVEPVPAADRRGNLAAAYARLLAHPDSAVRDNAALRWCVRGQPRFRDPTFRMVLARLVTHYWGNDHFLAKN